MLTLQVTPLSETFDKHTASLQVSQLSEVYLFQKENLNEFVKQCHAILKKKGLIYISFSPASRGVCAISMFDDYTYLRQYTLSFLIKTFSEEKFKKIAEFDEGSNRWDSNIHPVQKILSKLYLGSIFSGIDEQEYFQHNSALIFKKF